MASKQKIPKALREQLWLKRIGKKYESKCMTSWCTNVISVFDFQCGHDIPESKGGATILENLYPICSRCNLSMSNTYTFKEWCQISRPLSKWKRALMWMFPAWRKRFVTKENGIKSSKNLTNQNVKLPKSVGSSSKKVSAR